MNGMTEKLSACVDSNVETIRQRLERNRKNLADRLDEVNKAIEMLDKNPAFEECHNAILRAGY